MTAHSEIHELMSAYADNACTPEERPQVLDALANDTAAKAIWARQHLVGDLMRGPSTAIASRGFSDAVLAACQHAAQDAEDPAPMAEGDHPGVVSLQSRRAAAAGAPSTRRRSGFGRFAIAASVAVAAVVGVFVASNFNQDAAPVLVAKDLGPQPVAVDPKLQQASSRSGQRPVQFSNASPDARRQLSGYLMDHSQYRSRESMGGTLGYARVATFQAPQDNADDASTSAAGNE